MQKATASKIMGCYLTDTAFRGSINIYQGMTVNFFYVVFRVIAGIRYASVWFISMAVYYLVRYFLCGISVEGWTSLMLVMLAFFGLVLLSIGIMGIYLMNILNEAKKMPHYVIRREDTEEK